MQGLSGRVALVTGAGRGIGRAICQAYGAAGAKVAAVARSTDELESIVGDIREAGGTAEAFTADLSDPAVPETLLASVNESLGPVEVLVNNAGVGSSSDPKPLVEFDDEFWRLTLEVNLNAPYRLTKLALPAMIAAGWGRVITVASINSRVGSLHGAAYAASKHAVHGLSETLRQEYAGRGIRVSEILPGMVKTDFAKTRFSDAEKGDAYYENYGLCLEAEDIARSVLFALEQPPHVVVSQIVIVPDNAG